MDNKDRIETLEAALKTSIEVLEGLVYRKLAPEPSYKDTIADLKAVLYEETNTVGPDAVGSLI